MTYEETNSMTFDRWKKEVLPVLQSTVETTQQEINEDLAKNPSLANINLPKHTNVDLQKLSYNLRSNSNETP